MDKSPSKQADWLNCMNTGMQRFQKGRPQEAAVHFKRAAAIMPGRYESWVNLGSSLLESGQHADAAHAFQTAIAIKPNAMIAHMMLGDALRLLGNTTQSLDSYTRAVALQRTPIALNKLACALRSRDRLAEAEELYLEAERMDPAFSMARVNRATMQIERQRFDDAHTQLTELKTQALPPHERQEVLTALDSIEERARLQDAIAGMTERGDLATLAATLAATPAARLQVDKAALKSVESYANYVRGMDGKDALQVISLPAEWPLIEAMHMIPLVHSVDEYLSVKASVNNAGTLEPRVQESVNMEPAIQAARQCRADMSDPVKAEVHLRHWHALACRGVEGFSPGHFKYTQNWAPSSPTLARVNPTMCSGTMRALISDVYNSLPPGLLRAIVAFLGIFDPHPFADGNARVAMIWLNRELEWAGLMPALFSRDLGLKGQLRPALAEVRNGTGNVAPLLAVIRQAQVHARDFCRELAGRDSDNS